MKGDSRMKKIIAITVVMTAGFALFGCGVPQEEKINLANSFSGPYFSIDYPEGFNIETKDDGLLIKGEVNLEVRAQAYQGVNLDEMASLQPVISQVESRAKQLGAEFLQSEITLGERKAMLVEMYTADSAGLVAFVPLSGRLVTIGAEDPFKDSDPKNSRKTKVLRAIIGSFRLTKPDYFVGAEKNGIGKTPPQTGSGAYKGELLDVSLPPEWEAQEQGADGLMLLPLDPLQTDKTVSINIFRNTGKNVLQYTQNMMKVFGVNDYEQVTLGGTDYYMIKGSLAGVPMINFFAQKGATIFMIQISQSKLDPTVQKAIEGIRYK